MTTLLGAGPANMQPIVNFREPIRDIGSENLLVKTLWDRVLDDGGECAYAGGQNGTVIVSYDKTNALMMHEVKVRDSRFNIIYTHTVPELCNRIFVYVAQNDFVYILTSCGTMFTYFGPNQLTKTRLLNTGTVFAAAFCPDGVMFQTGESQSGIYDLYWCENFEQPNLFRKDLEYMILSMEVVPPSQTSNGKPLLFFISEDTIQFYDGDKCGELSCADVREFALSPDYTKIAAMCSASYDATQFTLLDLTQGTEVPVTVPACVDSACQLAWAGNDYAVLAWGSLVVVMNFEGESNSLLDLVTEDSDARTLLFPSNHYCLVVTETSVLKLEKVQAEIDYATSVSDGGTGVNAHPSARLVDACIDKSTKKFADVCQDEDTWKEAISYCLDASLQTDDVMLQQLLFKSAILGRSFLGLGAKEPLVSSSVEEMSTKIASVGQSLRVSNAFRNQLAIIVTPQDIQTLWQTSPDDILLRICGRGQFSVAVEIADFLHIDKRVIFTEWCFQCANQGWSDEIVVEKISKKRNESFDIGQIVSMLYKRGKEGIAKKLADNEKLAARVLPFYMNAGDISGAIDAARKSNDSSLFIDVVKKYASFIDEIALTSDPVGYATVAKLVGDSTTHCLSQLLTHEQIPTPGCQLEYQIRRDYHLLKSWDTSQRAERLALLKTSVETSDKECKDKNFKPLFTAWRHELGFVSQVREKTVAVVQSKGTGFRDKSANSILRKLISEKDLEAAKQFACSIGDEDRFYRMIGLVYADQISLQIPKSTLDATVHQHASKEEFDGLFRQFWTLTGKEYKKYWSFYARMCFVRFGDKRGSEFISKVPDDDVQKSLRQELLEKDKFIWQRAMSNDSFGGSQIWPFRNPLKRG